MPKVLTPDEVGQFEEKGFIFPVRAFDETRARYYRDRLESLEDRYPNDVTKLKTKSHLLCDWVMEIAEDKHILDVFEDLIGPNIRCWSMAWRAKRPDGKTYAGWHQDSAYGSPVPVVIGALALAPCGVKQGCLRGIPESHKWGVLQHNETVDSSSILARGQYINEPFDESQATDFILQPGEMVLFHNSIIHGSSPNHGPDRRILLLIEMMPTWAKMDKFREAAMLVRGVDDHGNFDDEPRPDGEFTETAIANWKRVVESRAKRLFSDSRYGASDAYGGSRAATY